MRRLGRAELLYPGIVFFAALLLYSWTLAPTVTLVDSGELIVAAHHLGVAHPPGFPLYLMLSHIASRIPIGNVAQRIHFASAVFAALASAVTTLLVAELIAISSSLKMRQRSKKRRAHQIKSTTGAVAPSFLTLSPALAAGLLIAFSRTLWAYATIAEVYALNAFLIVTIFWLICKWRRKILEDERVISSRRALTIPDYDWLLYTASAIFGFALGVHHVTVALILPALALLVWKTQGFKFFISTRFLYAAIVSILALIVVYAYLPLAASHAPIINWGNPRSLTTIWWHITGRQYRVFLSFDPNIIGQELVSLGRFLLREFGSSWLPITLCLALPGFAHLLKNDRTTFWFLALVVLADAAYGTSYLIAEDKDAYYLPAFIAIAVAAGFGLRWLFEWLQTKAMRATTVIALAAVLLLATTTMAANWAFDNRRHYFVAHDYVENILGSIEPNGLLLTLDWQVASPMFYTREIERFRRDVKVIDVNLLRRSWYFDYLNRSYPDFMARSRDRVEVFLADLRDWEHDPEAYARDPALTRKIAASFRDLLQTFVRNERQLAPVYVTSDLLFQTEEQDKELTQWLTKNYQLIPHGLVFKLEEDRSFHEPSELNLRTRGLADGTLKFEPDDVVKLKVLPAYKTMLVNRGRYFTYFKQYGRAIEAFKSALALDPKLDLAQKGLEESISKMQNSSAP